MKISTTSFAAGTVAALVLGSGTAYAATGGNFLLGKSNSAGATTTLTNANGTALSLNSKSGTAPLKVNRNVRVTNLNADLLDGLNSSSFAKASGKVGTIEDASFYVDLPVGNTDQGDGTPDFVGAFAACPAASKLTGGGGIDGTPGGSLWFSAPRGNAWAVASSWTPVALPADDTTTPRDADFPSYPDASDMVVVDAQCWNPTGSVSGAISSARVAPSTPAQKLAAAFAQRAH